MYIFCLFSFPIYCLQPVYRNASSVTIDRSITALCFSILLLPASLLTAIHLSEWCLLTIPFTLEAHPVELASSRFVL